MAALSLFWMRSSCLCGQRKPMNMVDIWKYCLYMQFVIAQSFCHVKPTTKSVTKERENVRDGLN